MFFKKISFFIAFIFLSFSLISQNEHFSEIEFPVHVNNINDLYKENRKTLWIATNKGIIRYKVNKKNFTLFIDFENPNKLKANRIIAKKNTGLWLGSYRSSIIDFNYSADAKEYSFENLVNAKELVTDLNYIDDKVYVTTAGGHIAVFDEKTKKFTLLKSPVKSEINAIWKEKSGKIWLSSVDGLFTYKKGKWKQSDLFFQSYGLKLRNNEYWVIGRDKEYKAKIMYLYNYKSDVLKTTKEKWANLVFFNLPNPHVRFNDFDFNSEGLLWLSSNYGVIRYNPYSGYTTWYTNKLYKNFPLSKAEKILVKDDNHIWVSYKNKLYEINLSLQE